MNLILGCANFENDYGKRLKKNECFRILDRAKELGFFALDTSPSYGDSELVIKEWLDKGNKMTVFSKATSKIKNRIGDIVLLHDENEPMTNAYDGISVYDLRPGKIFPLGEFWIQAPLNPLNLLCLSLSNMPKFIARSIFLKGMNRNCDKKAIAELTFGFLRSHGVKNCVFGVESVEELELNWKAVNNTDVWDGRNV